MMRLLMYWWLERMLGWNDEKMKRWEDNLLLFWMLKIHRLWFHKLLGFFLFQITCLLDWKVNETCLDMKKNLN